MGLALWSKQLSQNMCVWLFSLKYSSLEVGSHLSPEWEAHSASAKQHLSHSAEAGFPRAKCSQITTPTRAGAIAGGRASGIRGDAKTPTTALDKRDQEASFKGRTRRNQAIEPSRHCYQA